MNAVIIYDLNIDTDEITKIMTSSLSYYRSWKSGDRIINLPRNTIWKQNITLEEAHKELENVVKAYNLNKEANKQVKIERCIIVPSNPFFAIDGNVVS